MAFTPVGLSTEIYNRLSESYNGKELKNFSNAVGTGVALIVVTLKGQITAPVATGSSSGTGIFFPGATVATAIETKAKELFKNSGPELKNFTQKLGTAFQNYFATAASLSSNANGSAQFPAFAAAVSTMANSIKNQQGYNGDQWLNFCTAISYGLCTTIATVGTGSLSGAGGSGSGSGVVNIS